MRTCKDKCKNMREYDRFWSQTYGVISGVCLTGFGLITAVVSPVLGVAVSLIGIAIAAWAAINYKKA